jgi:O-methyltransferase domain
VQLHKLPFGFVIVWSARMTAPPRSRCELIGGNFLESVPHGADAYIMKRIFMGWDDEDCVKMLRLCGDAMTEGGRVLTVNVVMPPANQPHPGKIIDIFLMVQLKGRERTEDEFRDLYKRAGLKLTKIVHNPSMLSIVSARLISCPSQDLIRRIHRSLRSPVDSVP